MIHPLVPVAFVVGFCSSQTTVLVIRSFAFIGHMVRCAQRFADGTNRNAASALAAIHPDARKDAEILRGQVSELGRGIW